jgi:putative transposase
VKRAFKYRLFTNANQERELAVMLESHRRLYNVCLDYKELAYQTCGASLNYCDFSRWFKWQRQTNPYFARLNFSSAQATMRRVDQSFANFFRRVKEGAAKPGYPRFKGPDWFDSIEFPAYRDGIKLTGNRLYVQNVGTIRVKLHRPVEGKIKTVRLKREAGKWYVVFSCELTDVVMNPSTLPPVGIDVGLTHFLTTSNGDTEAALQRIPNLAVDCVAPRANALQADGMRCARQRACRLR